MCAGTGSALLARYWGLSKDLVYDMGPDCVYKLVITVTVRDRYAVKTRSIAYVPAGWAEAVLKARERGICQVIVTQEEPSNEINDDPTVLNSVLGDWMWSVARGYNAYGQVISWDTPESGSDTDDDTDDGLAVDPDE